MSHSPTPGPGADAVLTFAVGARCPFKVRRALDILRASPHTRVTLEELAESVHIDKFHLSRLFVRYLHVPPVRLHRALRLARACELILSGCPLSEAAAETGFADQSHLTRHFARAYGLPPRAYRRAQAASGGAS